MKTHHSFLITHSFLLVVLLALLVILPGSSAAQDDPPALNERLGITFISSADHPADEARYRQALLLGAGWNRWPLYWQWVERSPGNFDWSAYDRVVSQDRQHGLSINIILLGIPEFYRDGTGIDGLGSPIFSDGTDTPGAGKTPNPDNPWAQFVFNAVSRYRGEPGSIVWEAWNEPDLTMFWNGSVQEYARLLKVAYIAAHHADPAAQVMFGGLAYVNPEADDWLGRTLLVFSTDPQREQFNWYMDKVAVHNYSNPWRSGWVVRHAQDVLAHYGLTRPIWLNESGVPVWDDYPGPTWTANQPESRRLRATMQQQAAFVVQSTAYAWASGAEVVFFHQLYDDCGNQAGGTDFPPNNGELCATGACWGDAHGLFRNDRSAVCFRQSPMPGTARPAAAAFHLMARLFGEGRFDNGTVLNLDDKGVVIAFDRQASDERIYVMWNSTLDRINMEIPASGSTAELFAITNQDYIVAPTDNEYKIGLPPATRDDYPYLSQGAVSAIGGPPFILIEALTSDEPINPALVNLEPFDPSQGPSDTRGVGGFGLPAGQQVFPTPGPIIGGGAVEQSVQESALTPPPDLPTQPNEDRQGEALPSPTPLARPTVDPAQDSTPPVPAVLPLPIISPPRFVVYWRAQDDSGIAQYTVWVRVNGGEWQPWLDGTTETQAEFEGESGSTYEFAVWAQDLAGNWSTNTELTPQARTAVQ